VRVLVTGANGFLGREVVAALLADGHAVRALVRPATNVARLGWSTGVEVVRADLRGGAKLEPLLEGVEACVHLATQMTGDDFSILSGTLAGTERLLAALASSRVKRLVLCSSFSVFDWAAVGRTLDDDGPLPADVWPSGAYAAAKHWQERLARRAAEAHRLELTVLRPGFVWGRGNDDLACIGQRLGRLQLVFGPLRTPPFTHVTNCADAFRFVLDRSETAGKTYNVVDEPLVTAARFARARRQGTRSVARNLWLPYLATRGLVALLNLGARLVFGPRYKLPSMFAPVRFQLRYKPVRATSSGLAALGWRAPRSFEDCAEATWGARLPFPVRVEGAGGQREAA
jgi:UDP-glucose 4-epimerase